MCLAIFKPKGQNFISTKKLKAAWENNPHGAGLAIRTNDNQVKIIKGLMTFKELTAVIDGLKGLKNFDVLLHFRWATSGPKNNPAELCHPFPVSTKNSDFRALEFTTDKAIIHNGIMFQPSFNDYSDTAIFSRWMKRKNPSIDEIKEVIKSDRLAIMTGEKVEMIGAWSIVNGNFLSNEYSIEKRTVIPWVKSKLERQWDIWDKLDSDAKKDSDYDYAFSDSRKNDPYYYDSKDTDTFINEDDSLDFCPKCDSDNTEFIGCRTSTYECLDCGSVYNESHFLEASDEVKADIKALKKMNKMANKSKNKTA